MTDFGVVILAGGRGERFGCPKAFVKFGGKELWKYPYYVCIGIDECKEIVVVFPKGFESGFVDVIEGGRGRARDCLSALEHIESRRVVVLEAARPLVTMEQVLALAGGLYPSIIYGYKNNNFVWDDSSGYIPKGDAWELLGTGGYDTEMLRSAYKDIAEVESNFPCDSKAIFDGYAVKPLIWDVGPINNLHKVTYPHDIGFLGVIQRQMKK